MDGALQMGRTEPRARSSPAPANRGLKGRSAGVVVTSRTAVTAATTSKWGKVPVSDERSLEGL
jgi:hypothetical protein